MIFGTGQIFTGGMMLSIFLGVRESNLKSVAFFVTQAIHFSFLPLLLFASPLSVAAIRVHRYCCLRNRRAQFNKAHKVNKEFELLLCSHNG